MHVNMSYDVEIDLLHNISKGWDPSNAATQTEACWSINY